MSCELMIERTPIYRFKNNSFFVRASSFFNKFYESFCLKSFGINDNFLSAEIVNKKVSLNVFYPSCFESDGKLLLGINTLERDRLLKTGISKKNIKGYKNNHKVNIP